MIFFHHTSLYLSLQRLFMASNSDSFQRSRLDLLRILLDIFFETLPSPRPALPFPCPSFFSYLAPLPLLPHGFTDPPQQALVKPRTLANKDCQTIISKLKQPHWFIVIVIVKRLLCCMDKSVFSTVSFNSFIIPRHLSSHRAVKSFYPLKNSTATR